MMHLLTIALSLSLLLLLSSSLTAAADSPPSLAAQRVIRGWSVEDLSANRWSGAVLINDRKLWVGIAARGGSPNPNPDLPSTGLSTFNLSAHAPHVLSQVAAATPGRAWLRTGVEGQHAHHYAYVDLDTGLVLANVSHASFAPDDH